MARISLKDARAAAERIYKAGWFIDIGDPDEKEEAATYEENIDQIAATIAEPPAPKPPPSRSGPFPPRTPPKVNPVFKPGTMRRVAVAIVESFLKDKIQWADAVPVPFVHMDERNLVGVVWRSLSVLGIIERMDQARKSKNKARRGGVVFQYRIISADKAKQFLRDNKQPDLI